MKDTVSSSKRIYALDIMRGITIAGMILVNNPGNGVRFDPLRHAQWLGLTPTDLVFPFFMFIMGITTYLSLRKFDFHFCKKVVYKIIKRTALIWLIGLGIWWVLEFGDNWFDEGNALLPFWQRLCVSCNTFDHMRILGVLPRLGICYGLTAVIALSVKHKYIPWIIVVLLVSYLVILITGNGYAHDESNILYRVDDFIMGSSHMYHDHPDPEGILSTIPSLAHVLIGFCVARVIMNMKELNDKIEHLFIVGALLSFSGLLLSFGCPLCKKIWSPSFVLTTCGFASSTLALMIWFIDKKEAGKKVATFFEVFGVNPLFLYVLSEVLVFVFGIIPIHVGTETLSIKKTSYTYLFQPLFGDKGGSLVYAVLYVMLNWSVGYFLYKKKIYIKI
jgi:predicted acyltransferase